MEAFQNYINNQETYMKLQNLAESTVVLSRINTKRSHISKAALLASGLLLSMAAQAQTVVFDETFSAGLGKFTSGGSVSTSSGAASIAGCYGCTDGSITSNAISTVGFTGLRLSFDRTTSGLDSGESGIAEFSTNGSTYTAVESIRTASGRVTFNLPSSAEGQSNLRIRFRINASLSSETYTVDNVRLEGTTGGTDPTDPTNPYQKGPDPTTSSLQASRGPFTYTTTTVSSSSASGYGGGTIYHPTNVTGPFAAIAISPGYTGTQSTMSWYGPRLASHGFVVITIDTNSRYDQPSSRATQLMAALRQLTTFSNTSSHPIYRKVDPNRLGVMGHSMGGGGSLIAADNNPQLKAAIPLAPWNSSTNFSGVSVPTLIVACESDTVASVSSHASPFYNSIPNSTKKAYLEMNNGDHFCVMTGQANEPIIGKYSVSWMKRFMDNDTRYSPFLCGAPHQADLSNTAISEYRENCPY
jgi:dienelactone hydrolase